MAGMPRCHPVVTLVLAALALGGCVEQTEPPPQASDTTPTSAPPSANFPLRVERTGGVAGFHDVLVIQQDGSVVANSKRGQVSCTLDAASLAVLNTAARGIHLNDQPTPGTSVADGMTVTFSARFGTLGIDDPRVAAAEPVVSQLLADVSAPPAKRKICT
jgi:hypothetical protein